MQFHREATLKKKKKEVTHLTVSMHLAQARAAHIYSVSVPVLS